MTHQPLDGNLALQSLSIYKDQWYIFLNNKKTTANGACHTLVPDAE